MVDVHIGTIMQQIIDRYDVTPDDTFSIEGSTGLVRVNIKKLASSSITTALFRLQSDGLSDPIKPEDLDRVERDAIIGELAEDLSQQKIADWLNISQGTVNRVLRKTIII